MKTICWNTQELENPRGVCVLHDLTLHEAPNLLFLLETKLPMRKLEAIRSCVGMHGCIGVDNEGRGGEMALMWKDNLERQLIYFLSFHIHAWVNNPEAPPWFFTGIYSHLETTKRTET